MVTTAYRVITELERIIDGLGTYSTNDDMFDLVKKHRETLRANPPLMDRVTTMIRWAINH